MLDHQTLTLLVALGTVALTAILYVVIPKGLFPTQDVGVIEAISVADNSVSYSAMARRQAALAEAILKDPDVTSVTSYVGIDGINTTLNNGRFLINLRAHDDRSLNAQEIARRVQQEVAEVPGITLYLQPEQDLTLDTTVSPNQYKFVLRGPNQQTFDQYVPALIARMKQIAAITDVTSDLNNQGLSVDVEVNRQLAARYGITAATIDNALYDALGQRIVSTIFEQSDQYRVILVAKPETLPDLQVARQPVSAEPDQQHRPGAAQRDREDQGHDVAARDQPSGPVPRRHHFVQSGERRVVEHGGERRSAAPSRR